MAPPRSRARTVAAGILVSRAAGFLRDVSLAFAFGVGAHADVFRTALRGPNILQNLLGEQSLSASFIPVYSRLLAAGREEEAGRFAGAVFGLLLLVAGAVSVGGILLAEPLVALFAPGYLGDAAAVREGAAQVDRFRLAVAAVRWIFPMTGLLVLSAWALGVLNSHRRFFLPYVAPALWNAAIIAFLIYFALRLTEGRPGTVEALAETAARSRLLLAACAGALVGGALQLGVQLPLVARLLRGFRVSLSPRAPGVSRAVRAFGPLLAARGAAQLSAYLDLVLGSLLAAGAVGALGYAHTLYLLPVSLFGLSVAASELPELATDSETGAPSPALAARLRRAQAESAFLTVPTQVGYLGLGLLLVGALFQRGSFGAGDAGLVYLVLAGYSVGLLATNSSRLFANLFYAFGETGVPARLAVVRMLLAAALGAGLMLWLDRYPVHRVLPPEEESGLFLGAVGLAVGGGVAAWLELWLLLRAVRRRLPGFSYPWREVTGMAACSLGGLALAGALWRLLERWPRPLAALLVLGCYAGFYLLVARIQGRPELQAWLRGSGEQ